VRSASVRFYGSLNDFLPAARRQSTLLCAFESSPSVKDLVEALGVPHPEVDLLIVDGRSVDFSYRLRDGDRVAAYPLIRALDLGETVRLRPPPQTKPRFIADVPLGRLTAYLRLAGFDTKYRNDYPDDEIVAISASEDRVLLTRDDGVLKHSIVMRGRFLRETQPARQLVEVLRDFDLVTSAAPFTRCLRCNSQLSVVAKDPRAASASRADARVLPRILSMSDLQPHLLAGIALLAHAALHRNGFRGSDARQPALVGPSLGLSGHSCRNSKVRDCRLHQSSKSRYRMRMASRCDPPLNEMSGSDVRLLSITTGCLYSGPNGGIAPNSQSE
jgi:uncharacterized protein with PIN domain